MAALPYKENSFDLALLPQNNGYLSYQMLGSLTVQLKEVLSDNGIFVVIMQDEFVKRAGEENLLDRYDVQTGVMGGRSTIPDKGVYEYPWHFWTVAFAKYIIEKHFFLKQVEQIEAYKFMLVFRNEKGNGECKCRNKMQ